MLKARKAAHGGHEVGDTSMDPLVLTPEDEEMETPPPAMERVPKNREYHQNDADYVLFLLKQRLNPRQARMVASTVEKTLLADMRELTRFELIHTSRLAENEEPIATSNGFGSPIRPLV
nr:uncharacterized protein LOC109166971 [Ipomoea batatas]